MPILRYDPSIHLAKRPIEAKSEKEIMMMHSNADFFQFKAESAFALRFNLKKSIAPPKASMIIDVEEP